MPVTAILLATALAAAKPLPIARDPALQSRIDSAINRAIAEHRIVGVVVLVARDGQLVYHRAAGFADREKRLPMRENAIFRLASITKPLVSAALMRLVEQGHIRLDEKVSDFLPWFRPKLLDGTTPEITLRQLLTHSSGLSYRFLEPPNSAYDLLDISDGLDQPNLTLSENLHRLTKAPLAFQPGRGWRYSLSLDVLGAVIERATGETLPAAVGRLVTEPLALVDTGFTVTDVSRLVVPYADGKPDPRRMTDGIAVPLWNGAARFAPSRALAPNAYPSGGAGMVGTAHEILRFLEVIRGGGSPILERDTVAMMTADQVGSGSETQGPGWGFGYGWAVLDDPAPSGTPQSRGTIQWGGAYGHSWFVDRHSRLTVVALTNTAFEGMSGTLPGEIRNAVYRRDFATNDRRDQAFVRGNGNVDDAKTR